MIAAASVPASPEEWLKKVARVGLTAKGVVYCLAGLLGILAAMNVVSKEEAAPDKAGVFNFIYEQPYGVWLLGIIAIGLLCYSAWRFIQGIKDTEHKGKDGKGLSRRVVYVFSGIVYLSLAFIAGRMVLTHDKESGNGKQELAGTLMEQPFGVWLVGAVGLGMIANGIYQAWRAISGKYKKHVQSGHLEHKEAGRLLVRAGYWGYIARGVVWLIIGGLFIKAALDHNASEAGGSRDAMAWLGDTAWGPWLLGAISLGLICYGVFMFLRARYQPIHYR